MVAHVKQVLNAYQRWICKREYENQAFTRFNERPIEFGFVFRKIGELYPRTILDVGTGTTALPHLMRNCGPLVTAIDNVKDYWPRGMFNRHYHILDDDITQTRITEKFDMVTCVSVLEHIENSAAAMRGMLSLLNPGGHLLLTCPYTEQQYVKNVYELSGSSYGRGNSYITQSYSRAELDGWLADADARILEQEYWQCWEGDSWTVGKQLIPPRKVTVADKHQLSCIHIQRLPS